MLPPATKKLLNYPSTLAANSRNPTLLLLRFLVTADTIPLPLEYFIPKGGTWYDPISKRKEHNSGTSHTDVSDVPQETQT